MRKILFSEILKSSCKIFKIINDVSSIKNVSLSNIVVMKIQNSQNVSYLGFKVGNIKQNRRAVQCL